MSLAGRRLSSVLENRLPHRTQPIGARARAPALTGFAGPGGRTLAAIAPGRPSGAGGACPDGRGTADGQTPGGLLSPGTRHALAPRLLAARGPIGRLSGPQKRWPARLAHLVGRLAPTIRVGHRRALARHLRCV